MSEAARPLPLNHYACAKLLAESFCALYRDRFRCVILRPFNVIGPGQKPEFLIPKLARHFADRAPAIALGNLEVARDFVDSRDLAAMVVRVILAPDPPPLINLANGEAVPLSRILALFSELAGHSPEIRVDPALVRARDIFHQRGDASRIAALGHVRRHGLADTLAAVLAAAREKEPAP